jgi:hypothetical protein
MFNIKFVAGAIGAALRYGSGFGFTKNDAAPAPQHCLQQFVQVPMPY